MSSIDTVRKNKRKRKSLGAIKGQMKEKEENKKKHLLLNARKTDKIIVADRKDLLFEKFFMEIR